MSVNQIIENALRTIVPSIWPLVCPDENAPDEYVVYNPELDVPEDFGDNEAGAWVQYMQVHLYTRKNYLKKRKEIRKALTLAGFLISDITTMYEKDSKYYHLCFSCSIEENMEE